MKLFVESERRRPRALWRLLAQFICWQVLSYILGALLVPSLPAVLPTGGAGDSSLPSVAGYVVSLPAALLSVWLAGRFLDRRPFAGFGFHLNRRWFADFVFGLVLGAVLMTVIFGIEVGLGWISVAGALRSFEPGWSFSAAILVPLALYICVGAYEETVFRGYQLRNIAEGLNFPFLGPRGAVLAAWLLSSIFFGGLHALNPHATLVSTLNVMLAGLMLGLGYVLTGELAIPIGLHIAWNFFEGSVYGFPVSGTGTVGATFLKTVQGGPELWTGGSFGPEAGLLGILAVLLGMALTALWVRLRRGGLAFHTPLAGEPKPASSAGKDGAQSRQMR